MRVPRVLLDLLTVKYFVQHLTSPMKLFGGIVKGFFQLGELVRLTLCQCQGLLGGLARLLRGVDIGCQLRLQFGLVLFQQ